MDVCVRGLLSKRGADVYGPTTDGRRVEHCRRAESRHPGNPLSKRPQFRKQVPSIRRTKTISGAGLSQP